MTPLGHQVRQDKASCSHLLSTSYVVGQEL